MEKNLDPRFIYIGVKLPSGLAAEIRRQAAAEDRSVSAYLRRLLATVMPPPQAPGQDSPRG